RVTQFPCVSAQFLVLLKITLEMRPTDLALIDEPDQRVERIAARARKRTTSHSNANWRWSSAAFRNSRRKFRVGWRPAIGRRAAKSSARWSSEWKWTKSQSAYRALKRRSQRSKITWETFGKLVNAMLPKARILHPYLDVRFDARHSM
ncbi:MAG: hypothetical protein WCT04_28225, partial [Planctomycetota bacterium]